MQLTALGERLRPTDQPRYRTASPLPRQPDLDETDLRRRLGAIPSLFWPEWTVRISPPQGAHIRVLRPVLSAALLLPGSRLNLTEIAQQLGSVTRCFEISTVVQMLHANVHWPQIAAAMLRLVDHLDNHTVPIGYQRRRRRLDYRRLLPQAEWSRICRAAGTRAGQPIRWHVARAVLFERISGMPAPLAPFGTGPATAAFRAKMNAFPTTLTPLLADGLHAAAARFLARQGAGGEPVTWCPPLDLLDGLDLPGADIRQIDLDLLHHLVHGDRAGTATAGRRLGVSSYTVHTLLLHHPAPRPTYDPAARAPIREILPPDLLARYHRGEQLSLAQIDHRVGLVRGTAARLAAEYRIPVRGGNNDPHRSHPALPRDWMLDQYLNHQRSLADLAREKGMAKSTLHHWAKIYQIPIQRHRAARMNVPAAAAAAPPLLRPAITGPNAWQRLHRFADATLHPTFGKAATALGIHIATLIDHINRLEHEYGQPLLERLDNRRTMQPTKLGQEVIAAVRAAKRRARVPPTLSRAAPSGQVARDQPAGQR